MTDGKETSQRRGQYASHYARTTLLCADPVKGCISVLYKCVFQLTPVAHHQGRFLFLNFLKMGSQTCR